ncbi:lipopolysaccharide biosynthesis protein [Crateriforma spongiae]|uniref:lipopolysaccharide biosynthesis protein n=1 Tax=Crateriforma spongiae TaxID=2724528 RepID=UPI0039AF313F
MSDADAANGSSATAESAASGRGTGFKADSLALGMVIVLAMTIVQRAIGFFRGIWFCRLMDDAVVGQWSMAFGFITLITPVMLLGIPGSLPRYVEHFRSRGQLGSFLRRIGLTTGCLAVIGFCIMWCCPQWFGWLIFLQPQDATLIYAVGVGVLSIVFFNFINDLNSSLRQVRMVSVMQFMQGVGFGIGGVAWLATGGGLTGLVLTFSATTVLATTPGLWRLRRGWSGMPIATESFDAPKMWRRILPYAAALWAMNLIGNVFELSDRYMILHFMPGAGVGGESIGQSAVGQYHSGRILPMLFLSLATLLGGILMPYLAADWESGRVDAVRRRLKQVLLGVSACFTLIASGTLILSPWLFGTLLEGRYDDGLSLLPMAFVFCSWSALVMIGQNYLWVAEKGKWVTVALSIGLVSNIALNAWLLPRMGLQGAVLATLTANGIVMVGVWLAMVRCGYVADHTAFYVAVMPATVLAGPWVAVASVTIVMITSPAMRQWAEEGVALARERFAFLAPASA